VARPRRHPADAEGDPPLRVLPDAHGGRARQSPLHVALGFRPRSSSSSASAWSEPPTRR
jgi:hypothetical protein